MRFRERREHVRRLAFGKRQRSERIGRSAIGMFAQEPHVVGFFRSDFVDRSIEHKTSNAKARRWASCSVSSV